MKDESKKYHVGKFSLTDQNSALVITGKVEKSQGFISELFFVEIFPFDKTKQLSSISIAFGIVELRSFANQLEELQHGIIPSIMKHSGGKSIKKDLTISPSAQTNNILITFTQGDSKILFSLPHHMLFGFSKQIVHLADATMDAVYKTQQFINKKNGAK
jgi:hypothetical protein